MLLTNIFHIKQACFQDASSGLGWSNRLVNQQFHLQRLFGDFHHRHVYSYFAPRTHQSPQRERKKKTHTGMLTIGQVLKHKKRRLQMSVNNSGTTEPHKRPKKLQRKVTFPLYDLVREGKPLEKHPNIYFESGQLTLEHLYIFRHHDTEHVRYGEDVKRPLFQAALKVKNNAVSGFYYRPNEFYKPKDEHFAQIYGKARPEKDFDFENPLINESEPYWVDVWYHKRQKRRKRSSNQKRNGSVNEKAL